MLGFKLNHVSKRGNSKSYLQLPDLQTNYSDFITIVFTRRPPNYMIDSTYVHVGNFDHLHRIGVGWFQWAWALGLGAEFRFRGAWWISEWMGENCTRYIVIIFFNSLKTWNSGCFYVTHNFSSLKYYSELHFYLTDFNEWPTYLKWNIMTADDLATQGHCTL